jgi:hypothetical protein
MDIENEFRYVAEPMYCHGCAAAAKIARQYDQDERARLTVSVKLPPVAGSAEVARRRDRT